MLIQFRFKNFKSFRDDTILDLSATKITEHADHVVQMGNERILPTAAIYGANASGKSNIIEAFRYMSTYVVDSFGYGGEGGEKKRNQKQKDPNSHRFYLMTPARAQSHLLRFILLPQRKMAANHITMALH